MKFWYIPVASLPTPFLSVPSLSATFWLSVCLLFALPAPATARQWTVFASSQGKTMTQGCMVNREAPCDPVAMVYPFYMLDDGQGTRFLVDAGLSRWTRKLTAQKIPALEAAMIPVEQESWTGRDLKDLGLDVTGITAVLVTHSHWDHAAGLMDLDQTPVWMSPAEKDWISSLPHSYGKGVISQLYIDHPVRTYRWQHTALSRWFGKTVDISGDGTLLAVQLPGHTPGSTGYFVRSTVGEILFVGDVIFRLYKTVAASTRGSLLAAFVDWDSRIENRTLGQLARFAQHHPDVIIVPHHDEGRLTQFAGHP